jgi:hypothetical protein
LQVLLADKFIFPGGSYKKPQRRPVFIGDLGFSCIFFSRVGIVGIVGFTDFEECGLMEVSFEKHN